ncbi:MAG: AgmX/PglI C-terminal domain-containing protein [Myxococcales bacterium]|nr:AgmX/PglI C-terminal domain-containing protein [Myxococcales bacterium]
MSTTFKPAFSTDVLPAAFAQANPFVRVEEKAAAVPVGESYVMVPAGPRVSDDEVETMASAVEVQVLWGQTVLSVTHLPSGKGFAVGSGEAVDFVLPEESLGRDRLELVSIASGMPKVMIPEGARVSVGSAKSEPAIDLVAKGRAKASSSGFELGVIEGESVRVDLAGTEIAYIVRGVRAGRAPKGVGFLGALSSNVTKYVGLSLLGHLGVIASLAYFMPAMGPDDAEAMSRENLLYMQKILNAQAPAELKAQENAGGEQASTESGGKGERAQGAEGTMGKDSAPKANARWGFKGESRDPQVQRKTDLELAQSFGMVDLLMSSKAGPSATDPNAPSAKWGAFDAQGADPKSAMGSMWGVGIGDSAGGGAFGLSGTGEGGGGVGEGIGLDKIGGLGHGAGGGDGVGIGNGKDGIGNGHGIVKGTHIAKAPKPLREGTPTVNGHLPAETIQRVVRANFGRFRNCYDAGLRTNPSLGGRVVTKFVISRDGSVSLSADGGSDLPDRNVVSCVVRSYQNLSFPTPEGGQVTVTYPLVFTPAD